MTTNFSLKHSYKKKQKSTLYQRDSKIFDFSKLNTYAMIFGVGTSSTPYTKGISFAESAL